MYGILSALATVVASLLLFLKFRAVEIDLGRWHFHTLLESADIEKVDFTFIQLLLMLKNECSEVKIVSPSERFNEALSLYQLQALLESN